jgi:hypothetical protein
LVEICCELGLLVSAAGHVLVRVDDLAPRLEAAGDRALDGRACDLALLAAHLFVKDQAAKLHLHLADLLGLGRGHSSQQPRHRIERPIRVVAGEDLLMCPLVALVTDLVHQAALGIAKGIAEDIVPRFPHQLEQPGRIPLSNGLLRQHPIFPHQQSSLGRRFVLVDRLHFALDEGGKPGLQDFQRLADTFVIGHGHGLFLPEHRGLAFGLFATFAGQASDLGPALNQGVVRESFRGALLVVRHGVEPVG